MVKNIDQSISLRQNPITCPQPLGSHCFATINPSSKVVGGGIPTLL